MQYRDGSFLVNFYKDVTFCLSYYGQSPSYLLLNLFRQCNRHSLVRDMEHNRLIRVGEIS